ncbi:MAG: hypothetical protein CVU42_01040 [Chloroflexi bacterium HGW-Chloroflexi-4]|jgi:uncharacterized membrane protein|nr:MAG: hypothetical protein CVU42_01040 [Chloroflexi bacterium HGW-Chloroflexi-4]
MKPLFSQPHRLFVIIALIFGLGLIFLQPTGAGYDEETHIARIYEFSLGHPIPNSYFSSAALPESFFNVSYRAQKFLTPIDWAKITTNFQYTVHDSQYLGYTTRATYSPINYFPQAVIMRLLGYELNLPLPFMYYILRLTYLLSYTFLTWLAIRFIPIGKWLLFVLGLAPITLLQASTITADAITFGVSFLFLGWMLHLIIDKIQFNTKILLATILTVFLLASVKINSIPLIFLALFLSPTQFKSRKTLIFLWVALILFVAIVAGGWNLIAWQSDAARRGLEGTSSIQVILNSLKYPFQFVGNLINYIGFVLGSVAKSWIAIYGYGYWTVPGVVFILYPIALILGFLHDIGNRKMPLNLRIGLLSLFLLMFFGTFAIRLILKENISSEVATQGRYFVAVMPLFFIGLIAWGKPLTFSKWFTPVSTALVSFTLVFFLGGMGLSYYRLCGSTLYNSKDCLLPVYKNWNPSTDYMVQIPDSGIIQQSIILDCDKIDQIRLQVFNHNSINNDEIFKVSLVDVINNEILAEKSFSMETVPQKGEILFNFPAIEGVVNQELYIQIEGDKTAKKSSLGLAVSDPGEYRGSFSINDESQNKDLLIHYRCVKK